MITYGVIGMITLAVALSLYRSKDNATSFDVPVAMGLIACALAIYLFIGSPDYKDQPYQEIVRKQKNLEQASDQELVSLYEKTLEKNDTVEGRFALGTLFARNGYIKKAQYHLEKAYLLDKNKTPTITMAYIQSVIADAKDKKITNDIHNLIDNVLKKEPNNPQALFYLGLYFAQNHHREKAISTWRNLVRLSNNQSWQEMALGNLTMVIKDFDITPEMIDIQPSITKDNIDMIRNMVTSLEEKTKQNPDDKALRQRYDYVRSQLTKIEEKLDNP